MLTDEQIERLAREYGLCTASGALFVADAVHPIAAFGRAVADAAVAAERERIRQWNATHPQKDWPT